MLPQDCFFGSRRRNLGLVIFLVGAECGALPRINRTPSYFKHGPRISEGYGRTRTRLLQRAVAANSEQQLAPTTRHLLTTIDSASASVFLAVCLSLLFSPRTVKRQQSASSIHHIRTASSTARDVELWLTRSRASTVLECGRNHRSYANHSHLRMFTGILRRDLVPPWVVAMHPDFNVQ